MNPYFVPNANAGQAPNRPSPAKPDLQSLLQMAWIEGNAGNASESFSQHRILINPRPATLRMELRRATRREPCVLGSFDTVVVPAGTELNWYWPGNVRLMSIAISPSSLERTVWQELGVRLGAKQLRTARSTNLPELYNAARYLMDKKRMPGHSYSITIRALSRLLLIQILEHAGSLRPAGNWPRPRLNVAQFRKIVRFTLENHAEKITLQHLANQVSMSPWHFSRLFKASTGYSPMQFVLFYRIEQGMRYITDTANRMIDIALECGFCDQAHFNRCFKRHVGLTPGQYRKIHAEPIELS